MSVAALNADPAETDDNRYVTAGDQVSQVRNESLFIHNKPSRSNDTTELTRKVFIRHK